MNNTHTFYPIGSIDQFLPQIGRVVQLQQVELAIFRTSNEEVFALENKSPHPKGGPIAEGIVSGHILYDPLYDWQIDLRTGSVQAPDEGQVTVFPTKVEAGKVWVQYSY
ncbi:nitrite reductase small subunit NirD [Paenibacillus kyungheensis]|uniref:Nitrite reductase small subunit NirD n=1 Tax=Paenibacillus kyungheensis TaxID=1452732 RepID=A0AAX3M5C9_9BACL|nr:nitrite reductase small subunit NirD [Paenibacillus kyungheensis]WCT56744.1 nitrite reductase small subunit NirD [Paenibacillus kyungheensis]